MASAEEPGRSFVFSFGLERLGLVALRAPYVVAALVVVATVLGAMGVAKLQVDDSLSELFRTNTEEFHRYEAIDRRFPSSDPSTIFSTVEPGPCAKVSASKNSFSMRTSSS